MGRWMIGQTDGDTSKYTGDEKEQKETKQVRSNKDASEVWD